MERKWSLKRAFLYGLGLSVLALAVNSAADSGAEVRLWLGYGRPGEIMGWALGRVLSAPLIFVAIALIRNLFVKPQARKAQSVEPSEDPPPKTHRLRKLRG